MSLRSASVSGSPSDESLLACERALRAAQLAGDVTALERLIDDALIFTAPDGMLYGKQDDLAAHRLGLVRITRVWCERPDGWRIVAGHVGAVLIASDAVPSSPAR